RRLSITAAHGRCAAEERRDFMRMVFAAVAAVASVFMTTQSFARQTADEKALLADLDALFADAQLDIDAPGLVYGVIAGGELIHVKGFGARDLQTGAPVTAKTRFRIASMTKMMT